MLVKINQAVSEVIRSYAKVDVISTDKLEGIDSKRPICTVDVDLIQSTPRTHYYSENTVRVQIDYYGLRNLDLLQMASKLNDLFILDLSVGDSVLLIENKSMRKSSLNILEFEFDVSYLSPIDKVKNALANKAMDQSAENTVIENVEIKEE